VVVGSKRVKPASTNDGPRSLTPTDRSYVTFSAAVSKRPRVRRALAAAALGAASVFLPHWDSDDHWATPNRNVVVIVEQLDDDPVDPTFRSIKSLIEADVLAQRAS